MSWNAEIAMQWNLRRLTRAAPQRSGGRRAFREGGVVKFFTKSYAFRMAALLAVAFSISSAFAVKPKPSIEISILMGQARADATQADIDLTALETYSMANIPWQVHFLRLQQIHVHVGHLLKDVSQLKAIASKGTPGQQDAINRLDPLVQTMASNINAAIKYLNRNHSTVNMPVFTDQVRVNRLLIDSICNVARAHAPKDNTLLAVESQNR
jgi:hypothetical protein